MKHGSGRCPETGSSGSRVCLPRDGPLPLSREVPAEGSLKRGRRPPEAAPMVQGQRQEDQEGLW